MRSRSPDENSQCSFDSALNHSREEEEQLQKLPMRMLHQLQHQQHHQLDDDGDKLMSYSEYRLNLQTIFSISISISILISIFT